MRYTNGSIEINVPKAAYRDMYADKGFYPFPAYLPQPLEGGMLVVRATNGEYEILTTEQEFKTVYAAQGFKELEKGRVIKLDAEIDAELDESILTQEPIDLSAMSLSTLRKLAKEHGIAAGKLSKDELLAQLFALFKGGELDANGGTSQSGRKTENEPAGE